MPVQCTCSTCGATFKREPSAATGRRYCSRKCYQAPLPIALTADATAALVPLMAKGDIVCAYAVIDIADIGTVTAWRWQLDADGYAYRSVRVGSRKKAVKLHRMILGLMTDDGRDGDHINRNRLDCRRHNLRVISHGGNTQNRMSLPGSSSSYRGVTWDRAREKWQASVSAGGKNRFLGRYDSEAEAAEAARLGRRRLLPYATD